MSLGSRDLASVLSLSLPSYVIWDKSLPSLILRSFNFKITESLNQSPNDPRDDAFYA